MELKRCKNGHYYDPAKHSMCPHCGIDIDMDVNGRETGARMESVPAEANPQHDTVPRDKALPSAEGKTVCEGLSFRPGPGSGLACMHRGADCRGRDYRIRRGRNFIGRSEKMDICIIGDSSISRDKHAIVVYDPKNNVFMIQPGESREMVYQNGQGVFNV